MIINIKGKIKPYYIQALAMTFFPGEKFPTDEPISDDVKIADIEVVDTEDGANSKVSITLGDKTESAESFAGWKEQGEDRTRKISVGRAFYEAGAKFTGYRPPWGIMTGVRPAKVAMELMDYGNDYDETIRLLEDDYIASPAKAKLSADVARFEKNIITDDARKACSVYIAIPFCPTRCAYCSFVSYASERLFSLIPDYLNALADDIDDTFEIIKELGLKVSTVYIGGGTPTILNPKQLDFLLGKISRRFGDVREFTLEAGRPDTITKEKLDVAAYHGVGRMSVNAQTLNAAVLKNIGRDHTVEQFFNAYNIAASSGISDVNIDLIAGLPGDNFESFCKTVDEVVNLDAENLTVHTFTVKKSAKLREEEDVFDRDGNIASACVDYSWKAIMGGGYLPYYMYRQKNTVGNLENVGYSKPGKEGLYNIFMMEEVHSIFSCGASAVTKLVSGDAGVKKDIKRIFEAKYPYEYLRARSFELKFERKKELKKKIFEFYKKHKMS